MAESFSKADIQLKQNDCMKWLMSRLVDKYIYIYVYIYIQYIIYKQTFIIFWFKGMPSLPQAALQWERYRAQNRSLIGDIFEAQLHDFGLPILLGCAKNIIKKSAVGPAAESSSVQLWTSLLDFWAFSFLGTKRRERPYSSWCDLDTGQ